MGWEAGTTATEQQFVFKKKEKEDPGPPLSPFWLQALMLSVAAFRGMFY